MESVLTRRARTARPPTRLRLSTQADEKNCDDLKTQVTSHAIKRTSLTGCGDASDTKDAGTGDDWGRRASPLVEEVDRARLVSGRDRGRDDGRFNRQRRWSCPLRFQRGHDGQFGSVVAAVVGRVKRRCGRASARIVTAGGRGDRSFIGSSAFDFAPCTQHGCGHQADQNRCCCPRTDHTASIAEWSPEKTHTSVEIPSAVSLARHLRLRRRSGTMCAS